jgi:hypothetical protein
MNESKANPNLPAATLPSASSDANNPLRREFAVQKALFDMQPPMVIRHLESQARVLAEALLQRASQVSFKLPDRVVLDASGQITPVPGAFLDQMAGGLLSSLTRTDIRADIRHRLSELEGSTEPGLAAAAGLLRYATAIHMVHSMLPAGRSVIYRVDEGEEIPSIPVTGEKEAASAITAVSDAIAEEETQSTAEAGARGDLIVPYVPAARRFYLPQWVAFDDQGHLLVKSSQEAERMRCPRSTGVCGRDRR